MSTFKCVINGRFVGIQIGEKKRTKAELKNTVERLCGAVDDKTIDGLYLCMYGEEEEPKDDIQDVEVVEEQKEEEEPIVEEKKKKRKSKK